MNITKEYQVFKNKYIVQQRREHEYAINRYYAHVIDPFFTKIVYDLKLTPNMVTIIAGLLGIAASGFFIFDYWITGAILLQLHHFMDGADGNLARLTNNCSAIGAKLDKFFDQLVRIVLFLTLAIIIDVPLWAKILFIVTIYWDLFIVHYYILPFMRRNKMKRAKWKEWFLSKGIIPGFDHFTIFFLISLGAIFQRLDVVIYLVIILKNIDWLYRVWECLKTQYRK
ncbi:CDP-alcohol phosphatidyltransferase family protein [Niallia circulans]|uniref:CDP-alcohol phosphatidyltransferase family protein n=1 Tax=Niallia circulans TaxID=1397 RepID=UPI002E22F305|nr:CDP-alcohol phosphatidyltransferase family protein [Niallia circulans]